MRVARIRSSASNHQGPGTWGFSGEVDTHNCESVWGARGAGREPHLGWRGGARRDEVPACLRQALDGSDFVSVTSGAGRVSGGPGTDVSLCPRH